MITIEKQLKPVLNILIHYYRTKNINADFQVKNFILEKDGEKICDKSTFSKLENNKILCSDAIYFKLLKKLNKSYGISPPLNDSLQKLNKKILKFAEINDIQKIIYYLNKAITMLNKFQNYIIYDEIREIYTILLFYYEKQNFNKSLIDKYIELYELISEEIKPIFISIAYHYYSRVNIEEFLSLDIVEKSLTMKSNSIIREFLKCAYYVRINELIKVKDLAGKYIELCKNNKNNFYLVKFCNLMAISYRFSDPDKSIYYMSQCIEHFDNKYDTYETLKIYYHNMAYLAYDYKDFDSILYIYKNHFYDDIQFLQAFFYLLIETIHNTTKDRKEIQRILYIVISHTNNQSFHQTILKLYECIYIHESFYTFCNQLYKLTKLKDYFKNELLLKEIISKEIQNYCIQNNNLMIYHNFMKIFQQKSQF